MLSEPISAQNPLPQATLRVRMQHLGSQTVPGTVRDGAQRTVPGTVASGVGALVGGGDGLKGHVVEVMQFNNVG